MSEEKIKTDEEIMKEVEENRKKENLPKLRQILIETDGNKVHIVKAEIAGKIELVAILQTIINNIDKL